MSQEQEMVWVDFVGGPLHGQSRRLERGRTYYDAAYMNVNTELLNYGSAQDEYNGVAGMARYKIERSWKGKPGSHREWFTGVLV